MKIIAVILTFFLFPHFAQANTLVSLSPKDYQEVFKSAHLQEVIKIDDPISDKPINLKLLKLFDKSKKLIGYVREVNTTTGCNSACLPVIFTLYYNKEKQLTSLKSREGLTKKFHAPFTKKDMLELQTIINIPNPQFDKIQNPKIMVDAISSATLTNYKSMVIKKAAYTTLRVYKYNQHTLNFLKTLP